MLYASCSPAAERRKSLATAEGRGSRYRERISRGSGERFFRRSAAHCFPYKPSTAFRPWLDSYAAPRLERSYRHAIQLQLPVTPANLLHRHVHLLHDRDQKVRHRWLVFVIDMTSALQTS